VVLRSNPPPATHRSYHDGSYKHLTPESSIKTQRELGADIILTLDECTPFHVDKAYTEASMERSHRWELRCVRTLCGWVCGVGHESGECAHDPMSVVCVCVGVLYDRSLMEFIRGDDGKQVGEPP
jgi:hypothetical protein